MNNTYKTIIKRVIILHLILLCGCTIPPNMNLPFTSHSQTAIPYITPKPTLSLSVATQDQSQVADTPANRIETPTNSGGVGNILENPLDAIFLFSRDLGGIYFFLDPFEKDRTSWLEPERIRNPQGSSSRIKTVSFSPNRNQIAYQLINGEVWISDLMISKSTKIYELPPSNESDLSLVWTPDDIHLIIDNINPGGADFIYDTNTGKKANWTSQCSLLVLSPRTKNLAVACWSKNDNEYTYLEWGGEIWITKEPPEKVFVQFEPEEPNYEDPFLHSISLLSKYRSFHLYLVAGWSTDGKRIAYFDPQDNLGSLLIYRSDGTLVHQISHKAYWQNSGDFILDSLPGLPIQWSENGKKLLLFGKGTEKKPCLPIETEINQQSIVDDSPNCWQVIDSEKWDIQWYTGDLVKDNAIYYENADLSREGNEIAINSFYPTGNKFQVINLESNNVILDAPLSISDFRWGK